MNPAKQGIRDLVEICKKKGIKNLVISPGSRNAPIADQFIANKFFQCHSIIDERSAGFFALGMAQQLNLPVMLLCTSGSAVLNYAPAIAEAYYQKIPLLVITADRPKEWIGMGESQTIDQYGIFDKYIKKSMQLPQNPVTENDFWYQARLVSEAINTTLVAPQGPVHVNLSLDEPLYEKTKTTDANPKIIELAKVENRLAEKDISQFTAELNKCKKIMVLTGSFHPDDKLNKLLNNFAGSPSVVVLTETTANLSGSRFFPCIDRLLATMEAGEDATYSPDLLITFGDQVISKRIKAFIRNNRPAKHWHIDPAQLHFDTYKSLTTSIPVTPNTFLEQVLKGFKPVISNYHDSWLKKEELATIRHKEYLSKIDFSDLKAFEIILNELPDKSQLQMGNSSPVRYVQLFKNKSSLTFFSNRGTSGIEGCTSTAAGAAWASGKLTTLITGDISFLYDTNGLWNNHLSPKLRIIVINNEGGGIFRFIKGPDSVNEFETYIETNHQLTAELLAKLHGLHYFYAENKQGLKLLLKKFYDNKNNRPSILEIKTPRLNNAEILRGYFEYINKGE